MTSQTLAISGNRRRTIALHLSGRPFSHREQWFPL